MHEYNVDEVQVLWDGVELKGWSEGTLLESEVTTTLVKIPMNEEKVSIGDLKGMTANMTGRKMASMIKWWVEAEINRRLTGVDPLTQEAAMDIVDGVLKEVDTVFPANYHKFDITVTI